jgi:lysophospholipase L1-like esterase
MRTTLYALGATVTFGFLSFLYAGLYYPDPYYFDSPNSSALGIFLLGLRLVGALILLGVAAVWVLSYKRVLSIAHLGLMLGGCLMSLLFLVACIGLRDSLKGSSFGDFHPFLQLSPPVLEASGSLDKAETRIVFMGGSTTAWPDSKGIDWPTYVAERLERPGKPVRSLNAAKEWYTTQHTLINYIENVSSLEPNVVVVTHAINDLLQNADFSYLSRGAFRDDYGHFMGPLGDLVKRGGTIRNLARKLGAAWYHKPRDVVGSEFKGVEAFKRNLRRLIQLTRLDGCTIVLATQATVLRPDLKNSKNLYMVNFEAVGPSQRWSLETAVQGMKLYNNAVRGVAKQEGVHLIDVEAVIPKTFEYFSDEVHLKDAGFPKMVDGVAKGLEVVLETQDRLPRDDFSS